MNFDLDLDELVMTTALTDINDAKILIVDDNQANVALLEALLDEDDYPNIYSTTDPFQVMPMFNEQQFDLILLDIRMPGMSGIEILHDLRLVVGDDYLPVIVLTAQTDEATRRQALEAGAKDFITKPFSDWEVLLRVRNTLQTRLYYTRQILRADLLENEIRERTREIRENQFEIVQRLGVAGELRDNETGAHVKRMSHICGFLATKRNLGFDYSEHLLYASTMHDVGKIGIPDSILLKSGSLNEHEWQVMQQHPKIGAKIIGNHNSKLISLAREVALFHHEKWDGTGYPHGISGDSIPISAQIAAVSDVFDALTSERPYKSAWPVEKAAQEIENCAGTHFEPKTVKIFIENLAEIRKIKESYLDQNDYLMI